MDVSGDLHAPGENAHVLHLMGGWVDLRAGLDAMEKRKSYHYTNRTPAMQHVARQYPLDRPQSQSG
jgi:hypothetical protein